MVAPPGSAVHGILQARILEWVAISSSRESSQPRDQICGSCDSFIGRWVFLPLAPAGKPRAIMVQGKVGHRGWSQRIWLWRPVGFDYTTYTGLGKQTLGGHKQNLVRTRTQEKGALTQQETDPDLPVSVQESPAEAWVDDVLLQGWGHWVHSACVGPSEGGHHYLHYLHHSLASGQIQGGNTLRVSLIDWPHPIFIIL